QLQCSILSNTSLLFFFFSSRRRHTRFSRDWSSDVCSSDLFPTPGSPPTSMREPGTIPPPKTRSSSESPSVQRRSSKALASVTGTERTAVASRRWFAGAPGGATSSTRVFHPSHDGQRPNHFTLTSPHCWQTYRVRLLLERKQHRLREKTGHVQPVRL